MNKFNRWIRSTQGIVVIVAALVLVVAFAVIYGLSAGPGATFDMPPSPPGPANGFTCLPAASCADAEQDAKWISQVGSDEASFAGAANIAWIAVPNGETSFSFDIYDGDSGKDNNGNLNPRGGNWDTGTPETIYTIYADPLMNGSGTKQVATWRANGDNLPNNDWFSNSINQDPDALSPGRGYYIYRFEGVLENVASSGINRYKLRSSGFLSTGQSDLVDASIAIVGGAATIQDVPTYHPQYSGNLQNPGPSNYTGEWNFYILVPNDSEEFVIWDGDFDRGTGSATAADTDDPNTVGRPAWAVSAVDERAGGKGAPADDFFHPLYRRSPAVRYTLVDPDGLPVHANEEPSGTQEWERFVMSTDPNNTDADLIVDDIKPGLYVLNIEGLDVFNTVWIRSNYCVSTDPDGCRTPWDEGVCPRTIGYWKNNVNKVLIQNRNRGVQESRESLEWALDNVAMASELYRTGINVNAPVPISTVARLTDQEADAILQKDNGNSMLDRALQQNLATWLNLSSGKLGPTTVVELNVAGGTFNGTVWEALMEAQDIILNHQGDQALLERAKDLADQMNNGLLGEDAADSTCSDYEVVMPPDQQPPPLDEMPEAPAPPIDDEVPTDPPQTDGEYCARMSDYNIENPANNPFYGVKFNLPNDVEIKDGLMEELRITVNSDTASAMTAAGIQVEAKAANFDESATLSCQFDQVGACDPVDSNGGNFVFFFEGATDNGNGTLTLTFLIQNNTNRGLSHVTIGLPDGATATVCE